MDTIPKECNGTVLDGFLYGYVKDLHGNPLGDTKIIVNFHETEYRYDRTDSDGYYEVDNIPICRCLKKVTASKEGYKEVTVFIHIWEDTRFDFVLVPILKHDKQ